MILVHDTVPALRRAVQDNNLPLTIHDDGTIEGSRLQPAEGFTAESSRLIPQWRRCQQRILQLHPDGRITAVCLFKPLTLLTLAACTQCD